jgi:hypothetical protein
MSETSDREMEERLTRRLRELYPLEAAPTSERGFGGPSRPRRQRVVLLAAAASVVAIVGLSVSVSTFVGTHRGTVTQLDQVHDPSWVRSCFTHWAPPAPGDSSYVGLTRSEALQLAESRGQQLVLLGAGGVCTQINDLVMRPHPVAVAFDQGDPAQSTPADAVVEFADSNPEAQFNGWGLN